MRPKTVLATTVLLLAGPAVGHHSDAGLDMGSIVTIEGVVTEYTLRNPHSYFVVAAPGAAGETAAWEIQMGSALSMSRRGWTAETLGVGNRVVVSLHPARDGRPYGLITALERDGLPISYERLPPPETQVSAETIEGVWMVDRESLGADYPGGLDQL
ncbi:MAG TPA: DUF6152 family protein, partial [Gammaproteobacteria bacterium]|nr:DUF6152 family protein [Gammaproteobacteria bacterium]